MLASQGPLDPLGLAIRSGIGVMPKYVYKGGFRRVVLCCLTHMRLTVPFIRDTS
jgi:hypothetical protein